MERDFRSFQAILGKACLVNDLYSTQVRIKLQSFEVPLRSLGTSIARVLCYLQYAGCRLPVVSEDKVMEIKQ